MFDDEFIARLPDEHVIAVYAICNQFQEIDRGIAEDEELKHYHLYLRAMGFFQAFAEAEGVRYPFPDLRDTPAGNIRLIRTFMGGQRQIAEVQLGSLTVEKAKAEYAAMLRGGFSYEFSSGDLARIQQLVNELRDFVQDSPKFDDDHRRRILRKLESLQSELHKRMSNIDRLWALVGEAGIVLGKLGEDAKPFVDRVREIAHIVWRVQARAEELPSGASLPLLQDGPPETKGNDE